MRAVYIGRESLHARAFEIVHIVLHFVGVGDTVVDDSHDEVSGIITFEICRLVGQECISRRVRLVERIACKLQYLVEQVVCNLFADAVCHCAGDVFARLVAVEFTAVQEDIALLFENGKFLLCDSTSHDVRATETEARDLLRDLHDLFLIHDTAVGVFKDVFKKRMRVLHLIGMTFTFQKQVDKLHGTGTVHRNACDDVFETVGLQLRHKAFHTAAFKLEHRFAISRSDEFVHFVVFVSEFVEVKVYALVRFYEFQRFVDVGERFKPQKVHFEKTEFFDDDFVELSRDDRAVSRQSAMFDDRVCADNDACGVHRRLSRHTFESHCNVNYRPCRRVVVVYLFEVFAVKFAAFGEHLRKKRFAHCRDFFHPVCRLSVRHVKHARDVLYDSLCRHRGIRDNLRNVVFTVLFDAIIYDFLSSDKAEVHVEVRHRNALFAQKSFKEQVVFERIDVGDAYAVRNDRSAAASAPRSDGNSHLLRRMYVVPHDKEVSVKSALVDDAEFVFETFCDLVIDVSVFSLHAFVCKVAKILRFVPVPHLFVGVFRDD